MKRHAIHIALTALVALALVGGFAASAAAAAPPSPATGTSPSHGMMDGDWCGGGMWDGSGEWGGTGMWGTGSGMRWLTGDPAAFQAWLQIRSAHLTALQTWYDTYKPDLRSAEAQQALHDLWQQYWNDRKAFYEQYAPGATWVCPGGDIWGGWDTGGMMGDHHWDATHMWGAGYGAAWMTGHPRGFGHWLQLRQRQTAAVAAWRHTNAAHPRSDAAVATMHALRDRQRAQVRSFFTHHGLRATKARMTYGAGGWMGLGGMWGGWGW